ncbi:MAG: UPF0149 family protein [Mariprofundus sp.]|nr:UPF0149 family protein [Mariprofundus sp.]
MSWNRDDTLAVLSFPGADLPAYELGMAVEHYEEIREVLHGALKLSPDAIEAIELEAEEDYMLQFFAMYLAAAVRDKDAFPLIRDFFAAHGSAAATICGDMISEHLDRILFSICNEDAEALKLAVDLPGLDEWVRVAFISALGQLYYAGLIDYEKLATWFYDWFTGDMLNQTERTCLAHECVYFGLKNMEEVLVAGLAEGRIDSDAMSVAHIRKSMDDTIRPDHLAYRYGMVDDVIDFIRVWYPDASGDDEPMLFEDDELDAITDLLDIYNYKAEEIVTLECVHGFIFAIALTPEKLTPNEWLPALFAGEMQQFESIEQVNRLFSALIQLLNRLHKLRLEGLLFCPVMMHPGDDSIKLNELREWCRGFVLAAGLRNQYWMLEGEQATDKKVNVSMGVMLGIADDRILDEMLVNQIGQLERQELLAQFVLALPNTVQILIDHTDRLESERLLKMQPIQREKVGRNEPCPCGSGKKFKKCCGIPGRSLH